MSNSNHRSKTKEQISSKDHHHHHKITMNSSQSQLTANVAAFSSLRQQEQQMQLLLQQYSSTQQQLIKPNKQTKNGPTGSSSSSTIPSKQKQKLKISQSQSTLIQSASAHGTSQSQQQQQQSATVSSTKATNQQQQQINTTTRLTTHHRRKSSERHTIIITNEGSRKAIRDFNVLEMHGRSRQSTQSMKILSSTTSGSQNQQHQTKRMAQQHTTGKSKKTKQQSQLNSKGHSGNGGASSLQSKTPAEYRGLPLTVEVDEMSISKEQLRGGGDAEFSADLYGGGLSFQELPAQFQTINNASTSTTTLQPPPKVSIATINLTVANSQQQLEIISGSDQLQLSPGDDTTTESNQVMATSITSSCCMTHGAQLFTQQQNSASKKLNNNESNLQKQRSLLLETQSIGANTATRFGANPQEDRSFQTIKISRSLTQNQNSAQKEEDSNNCDSSAIIDQSILTSQQQLNQHEDTTTQLKVDKIFSSSSKNAADESQYDHRRCLTTTADANLSQTNKQSSADFFKTFTSCLNKKQSLAVQVPRAMMKPQTTTKKNSKPLTKKKNGASKATDKQVNNNSSTAQLQSHLHETNLNCSKIPIQPYPQTTRHSTTSFGFTSAPFTASKGNLANNNNNHKSTSSIGIVGLSGITTQHQNSKIMTPCGRGKTPPAHSQTQMRQVKSARNGGISTTTQQQQKLTNLAPKFSAARVMKHSSTVAKPGVPLPAKNKQQQISSGGGPSQQFKLSKTKQRETTTTTNSIIYRTASKTSSLRQYVSSSLQRNGSQQRQQQNQACSHSKTQLKQVAAASQMLGSSSLNSRKEMNKTQITNRINVSHYNSASSLKELNQSSQLVSNKLQIHNQNAPAPSYTTTLSDMKRSSLKKQQVLVGEYNKGKGSLLQTSSFLEQARQLTHQDELQQQKTATTTQFTNRNSSQIFMQPRSSLRAGFIQQNQQTEQSSTTKAIKRVPKHLIRASSHSGLKHSNGGQSMTINKPNPSKMISLKKVAAAREISHAKPQTKCKFTQLQIIRQKDSSGSLGNEQNNSITSRIIEDMESKRTFSSNHSGVAAAVVPDSLPSTIKVQRQSSAHDCRTNNQQVLLSRNNNGAPYQQPYIFDTQVNNSSNQNYNNTGDVRHSAKEMLSSLGKQTPSQFADLSNGLPDCLRSSEQLQNKQQYIFANNNNNIVALEQSKQQYPQTTNQSADKKLMEQSPSMEDEKSHDHRAFLHDFLEIDQLATAPKELQDDIQNDNEANDYADFNEPPYQAASNLLNDNVNQLTSSFPQFQGVGAFQNFSASRKQQQPQQPQPAQEDHQKQPQQNLQYNKQQHSDNLLLKVMPRRGGGAASPSEDGSHNQLLQCSFLSTDPNQYNKNQQAQPQITRSSICALQLDGGSGYLRHSNFVDNNQSSVFKQSGQKLMSLSHSRKFAPLKSSANNSWGASGDDPVWTLSDEDGTTARMAAEKTNFVFRDSTIEEEQKTDEDEVKDADRTANERDRGNNILNADDLLSAAALTTNRPSIDQMLATRYSQLLLDSQGRGSSLINTNARQYQQQASPSPCKLLLRMTPTDGSSSYLARKQRLLDEHCNEQLTPKQSNTGAAYIKNGLGSKFGHLVLPFESDSGPKFPLIDTDDPNTVISDYQQPDLAESTIKEDEYGSEVNQLKENRKEQQMQQQQQQHHQVSVMDGVMLDKHMADKWFMNQDQICPKVIVDDDEEEEDDYRSE